MAGDIMIKFYSGTADQLSGMTEFKDTCIGFQTDTGKLFWKYSGNKYYLKLDQSDVTWKVGSNTVTFQQKIQEAINSTISLPVPSYKQLEREDLDIEKDQIQISGYGTEQQQWYPTRCAARPCWLMTSSGSMYSVQPQSVSIQSDGTLNIQLSRYMAYQNVTAVPNGWKFCYR